MHVFIVALVACVCMTWSALFMWQHDLFVPASFLPSILLILMLVCVLLVTYIIYQSLKLEENARVLATHMTKNMLVYSHELFTEMYRSSPVPYMLIDAEGRIESANLAAARLFNGKEDELLSQNVFQFITGKDETKTALIPEYYKQGKFLSDVEVQLHHEKSTTKWVMLSLFSFRDDAGLKKGLLTLVDITKQKMVDQAKTEFVSLASHQLRTPISAMKWNIELLESAGKGGLNTVQTTYMKKINHGLERMDLLVRDFLSASKLELGTLTPEIKVVEAEPFLSSVCEERREEAEQKKIRFKVDLDKAYGTITTDPHLLSMVIDNLLGNALKYSKEGGSVQIEAKQRDRGFSIRITDSGIGIPEEEQKMIFSKLFRATNARTHVSDGTGLGLYIVHEIVRILGGTITFESKLGIGTSFIIMLQK